MSNESRSPAPVLVVGAGPVGLTIANLLVSLGVVVVVVERNATTSDEAKAISLDAESLRVFQAAGIASQVERIVVPGTGTRYYDRHDRPLFHARGGRPYQLGYAFKNQFAQPELEGVLVEALRVRADVRFGAELIDLVDHEHGVRARVRDVITGAVSEIEVSWVAACDGGRSAVRQLLGIEMSGRSHDEAWLVVDTVGDHHRERYGMHHGNPERPVVIVPGRDGRCRYEFKLREGEATVGERPPMALLERLLAPYRSLRAEQIERSVVYRFHAIVADRWRSGHCFLLGDAAHMMPPFAGQGLNSGVRDAANLAWKLAMVWRGALPADLLDTYEMERRPHALATVAFSERLGRVVMTSSRRRALARDLAVRAMMLLPAARRYLSEMRYRPKSVHTRGLVSTAGGGDQRLVGTLLPQPAVITEPSMTAVRLDEVLGHELVLLGVDVGRDAWSQVETAFFGVDLAQMRGVDVALDDRLPTPEGGRDAVADADGALERALASARGRFVLVKPDRYVGAVFAAEKAAAVASDLSRWLHAPRLLAAADRDELPPDPQLELA